MAPSTLPSTLHFSPSFVESCGGIVFSHAPHSQNGGSPRNDNDHQEEEQSSALKICLLHHLSSNEFLLPKGRRELHESRTICALREVFEETGYACTVLPVRMATRCTLESEEAIARSTSTGATSDDLESRIELPEGVSIVTTGSEPFAVGTRTLKEGYTKFLYWYLMVVKEGQEERPAGKGERQFEPIWINAEEAVKKATFDNDQDLIRKAVDLVLDKDFEFEN